MRDGPCIALAPEVSPASVGARMSKKNTDPEDKLAEARELFVSQWGALGGSWGVNRTMAQIHALLLVTAHPLSQDDVMAELEVSRGNASTNLRDLVAWGLIRPVAVKGDRKDYYEAEKDVWKIFRALARERKKREMEPAAQVLRQCLEKTEGLRSDEAKAFREQITALADFADLANSALDKLSGTTASHALPVVLKLLK